MNAFLSSLFVPILIEVGYIFIFFYFHLCLAIEELGNIEGKNLLLDALFLRLLKTFMQFLFC